MSAVYEVGQICWFQPPYEHGEEEEKDSSAEASAEEIRSGFVRILEVKEGFPPPTKAGDSEEDSNGEEKQAPTDCCTASSPLRRCVGVFGPCLLLMSYCTITSNPRTLEPFYCFDSDTARVPRLIRRLCGFDRRPTTRCDFCT